MDKKQLDNQCLLISTPKLHFTDSIKRQLIKHYLLKTSIGKLEVIWPDGLVDYYGDDNSNLRAVWVIKNLDCINRILLNGEVGLAEGYLCSEWTVDSLNIFLEIMIRNVNKYGFAVNGGMNIFLYLKHLLRSNNKKQSKKNIQAHYDLGNDFYSLWLDPTMSYSSAFFNKKNVSLEIAQLQKYDRILDILAVRPGDRILEIGCGWGGFMERAAKRGCYVTGITLSPSQLIWANERMINNNLEHYAQAFLRDYRDESGSYDHIVSIEMYEAVGKKYWPVYFNTIYQRLKSGGKAVIQAITINDDSYVKYAKSSNFFKEYIFPGSELASITQLEELIATQKFTLTDKISLAQDYVQTLTIWIDNFNNNWLYISQLGFDKSFKDLWNYYLDTCIAGFRTQHVDDYQLTFIKEN